VSDKIASILERSLELSSVFEEVINRLDRGEIDAQTVRDLVRYAAYRLQLATEENKRVKEENQ
jgi:hypothetical protein